MFIWYELRLRGDEESCVNVWGKIDETKKVPFASERISICENLINLNVIQVMLNRRYDLANNVC